MRSAIAAPAGRTAILIVLDVLARFPAVNVLQTALVLAGTVYRVVSVLAAVQAV
jgi:hypothetical protein